MKLREEGLLAEINVVPLVDIVLVLLIIFMITAPLMTTGILVDLPKTKAGPIPQSPKKPLTIVITREGKVRVGREFVSLKRLEAWLKEAKDKGLVKDVRLQADEKVPYGVVARVLGLVEAAGISEISLITIPVSHEKS